MPLEIFVFWQQYPWVLGLLMCQLKAVIQEAASCASILTIVAFTLERYVAICHPIHNKTKSKFSRATKVIIVIWAISILTSFPYGKFIQINHLRDPNGNLIEKSKWCGFPYNDPQKHWESLIIASTLLFFVIPMSIISILYFRIALVLHRSGCLSRSNTTGRFQRKCGARTQSRRAVIRMLCAVVIAFFICWAPYHTQRILFVYVSIYGTWTDYLRQVNEKLFIIAGVLYYFNSAVNPIVYSVMSNRFRVAFRETLCSPGRGFCCCFNLPKAEPQHISSYRSSNSQNSSDRPPFFIFNDTSQLPLNDLKSQKIHRLSASGTRSKVHRTHKKRLDNKYDSRWRFLPRLKENKSNETKRRTQRNRFSENVDIVKCGVKVIPDLGLICLECSLDLRRIEDCPYCSEYSEMNRDNQFVYFGKGSLSTGDLLDDKTSTEIHYQISESAFNDLLLRKGALNATACLQVYEVYATPRNDHDTGRFDYPLPAVSVDIGTITEIALKIEQKLKTVPADMVKTTLDLIALGKIEIFGA
ncbi:Neuropeptides capa receptor [Nymphon striatum]|nr:Neuropeptides capa receptor [Nymphon striatum]